MKRIVSLFMLAALLLQLVSCGGAGDTADTAGTTAADTLAETAAETDRSQYKDSLPELDFGGAEVTIYSRDIEPFSYEMGTSALNGEIVNDSLYERSTKVSERFGVVLKNTVVGDPMTDVQKLVLAGDGSCDIIADKSINVPALAVNGMLYDLLGCEYFDFDMPWWPTAMLDEIECFGRMFYCSGDIALTMIQYLCGVFYNKELAESWNIDTDFTALTLDGGWTLDVMSENSAKVSSDLNGNGEYDLDDLYGFLQADSVCIFSFATACGLKVIDKDNTGTPYISINNEKTFDVIDKVNVLFHQSESSMSAYLPAMVQGAVEGDKISIATGMFGNDQALFYVTLLYTAEQLREMESDFAILPYPKYDEAQESYHSNCRDTFTVVGIPICCTEPNRSAAVIEALSAESYRTVVPDYYEVALKEKYTRDETTGEMLDIITSSVSFDLGVLYYRSLSSLHHTFQWCIEDPNKEFGSQFAAKQSAGESGLKIIIESFKNYDDAR